MLRRLWEFFLDECRSQAYRWQITQALELIEGTVRAALAERALTPAAAETEILPVAAVEYPRLRGAAALLAAPAFAARLWHNSPWWEWRAPRPAVRLGGVSASPAGGG